MNHKIETMFITPEIASEMLKANVKNRNMNQGHVLELAAEMTAGRWSFNGEPISFSEGGILLNGQHRLAAIVHSGISQMMIIIRGLPSDSFRTFDVGKKRSAGDVFSIIGEAQANNLAAITRSYICSSIGNGLSSGSTIGGANAVTPSLVLEVFKKNEMVIRDILSKSSQMYQKMRLMTIAELGGYMAHLILDKKHPEEKVYSFFHQLFYADGIENGTIMVLRDKIVNSKMIGYNMTFKYRKALITKCWNAYCKGKVFKNLSYNENKEDYPEFL